MEKHASGNVHITFYHFIYFLQLDQHNGFLSVTADLVRSCSPGVFLTIRDTSLENKCKTER